MLIWIQRSPSPKFGLSETLSELLNPNKKNDFTFWLISGLSPNLRLSESLSERLQKVKWPCHAQSKRGSLYEPVHLCFLVSARDKGEELSLLLLPKNTRRRGVEEEMNEVYLTWSTMETTAQDRAQWRQLVSGMLHYRSDKGISQLSQVSAKQAQQTLAPHCRVLPPGELNCVNLEPLPV